MCVALLLLFGTIAAVPMSVQARGGHSVDEPSKYDDHFRRASKRFFGAGFPWRVFKAQALAESGLRQDAVSPVGARCIMQIMPATGREIRQKYADIGPLTNPKWCIYAGVSYDRWQWKRWPDVSLFDRLAMMLAGYNAGYGHIRAAWKLAKGRDDRKVVRWPDVVAVAPQVKRWRRSETIPYVFRIFNYLGWGVWLRSGGGGYGTTGTTGR